MTGDEAIRDLQAKLDALVGKPVVPEPRKNEVHELRRSLARHARATGREDTLPTDHPKLVIANMRPIALRARRRPEPQPQEPTQMTTEPVQTESPVMQEARAMGLDDDTIGRYKRRPTSARHGHEAIARRLADEYSDAYQAKADAASARMRAMGEARVGA